MTAPSFDEFLASIGRIDDATVLADPTVDVISAGVARIQDLPDVTVESLAGLVVENPSWIRVLGLAVGLGQEQLQITLHAAFGTRSYTRLAMQSVAVVQSLNTLGVVDRVREERSRTYGYEDVLLARYGSRATAGRAIGRGRALEDTMERIVSDLHLPHVMRTRFRGSANRTAPCDLAIPTGDGGAEIAVGIKGFNSTGSKLTDARREIEEMAAIRLPRQFVLAVVDGLGWHSRRSDLLSIHDLWASNAIDGVYTQATLGQFRIDVARAARLRGIASADPDA